MATNQDAMYKSERQKSIVDDKDRCRCYRHYIFAHFIYDHNGVYDDQFILILPDGSDVCVQCDFYQAIAVAAKNAMENMFDDSFVFADYDLEFMKDDLSYNAGIYVNELLARQEASDCDIAQFIIHQLMQERQTKFNQGKGTIEDLQTWVSHFNSYMETAREQGNYCYLTVCESRDFALGIIKELLFSIKNDNRSQTDAYSSSMYQIFKPLEQDISSLYYEIIADDWPASQKDLEQFLVLLRQYQSIVEK